MLPGPSIQVCKDDKVVIDVENHIPGMEAAIHWHGIYQNGSQHYDGVPFITQCPIPEGTTFRYYYLYILVMYLYTLLYKSRRALVFNDSHKSF